tara:strand:+ start:2106 stop:2255 length:150 start_codon:yes stop_codon:yes gene_type:complete
MAKNKMPPELLAHFKKKNEGKEDEAKSDKDKRKEALDKAKSRMKEKKKG